MVSLIVPVYNAEPYLNHCINSILNQTYQDFELILIDDGSVDNSLSICNKYVREDSRVKCISIRNSGANHARKVGVEYSSGDYIMFVDADDTISCNALEDMVNIIDKHNIDLVVAHMREEEMKISGQAYLIDVLHHACWVSMYFKIYRADVLRKNFIEIPIDLKYGEDLLQNVNIAKYVDSVMYCNIEYYHYRMVPTSITHTMQFCQDYEDKFQEFLVSCLFDTTLAEKLSSKIRTQIDYAWARCYLDGLKNVIISSSTFDFENSNYLRLRTIYKNNDLSLGIDDKILLYCNSNLSLILLRFYYFYCRMKNKIKKNYLTK